MRIHKAAVTAFVLLSFGCANTTQSSPPARSQSPATSPTVSRPLWSGRALGDPSFRVRVALGDQQHLILGGGEVGDAQVGLGPAILVSANGSFWQKATMSRQADAGAVTHLVRTATGWLAVSSVDCCGPTHAWSSLDGMRWEVAPLPSELSSMAVRSISYSQGEFVVIGTQRDGGGSTVLRGSTLRRLSGIKFRPVLSDAEVFGEVIKGSDVLIRTFDGITLGRFSSDGEIVWQPAAQVPVPGASRAMAVHDSAGDTILALDAGDGPQFVSVGESGSVSRDAAIEALVRHVDFGGQAEVEGLAVFAGQEAGLPVLLSRGADGWRVTRPQSQRSVALVTVGGVAEFGGKVYVVASSDDDHGDGQTMIWAGMP